MRMVNFVVTAALAALVLLATLSCQDGTGLPTSTDQGPGTAPVPPPSLPDEGALTLAPASGADPMGREHTVVATLRDGAGAPLAGAAVHFLVVSGPNAGIAGLDTTDAGGQAAFTYGGSGGPGRDVIAAALAPITIDAGGVPRAGNGVEVAQAEAIWIAQATDATGTIGLAPASARRAVGTKHTVQATLSDAAGDAAAGVLLHFLVVEGPNVGTGGVQTTDASGTASFAYDGEGGAGRDRIAVSTSPLAVGALVPALDPSLRAESHAVWVQIVAGEPVADAGGPYLGRTGESIEFDGGGSSDPEGGALTYAWSFGDGGTATGATPSHVYASGGDHSVVLTVTDEEGLSDADTTTVGIRGAAAANLPPTADAGGPYGGRAGQAVAFDGAASTDPEGASLTFAWSFGDGATGTGAGPTHTYGSAGTYRVVLTVSDLAGGTDADTTSVEVTSEPAVQQPGACTTVSFDDLGAHGTEVSGFNVGTDAIDLGVTPGGPRSQPRAFLYDTDLPDTPDFDLRWSGPGARCPGCQGLGNVLVIPDLDFPGEGDSGDGGTFRLTGFTPGAWVLAGLTAVDSDEAAWVVRVDGVTVAQTVPGQDGNVQSLTPTANPIVGELTIQLPAESGAIDELRFCPFEPDPAAVTDGIFTVVSGRNGGTVIAGNGLGGIFFPPGWSDVDRLVVSVPLDPPALDTDNPQFPAQFFHQTYPDIPFEELVTVGHCAIFPDEFTPAQVAALRLAKNLDPVDPSEGIVIDGIKVFDLVTPPFTLPACVEAAEARVAVDGGSGVQVGPKREAPGGLQLAARLGVGGQVSAFSPFGVVLVDEGGAEGGVSGTVVSATTGAPLPGATVQAFCPADATTPTATTTANASGAFAFEGLPAGDCRLRGLREGFVAAERTVTVTDEGTTEIGVLALVPTPTSASEVTIVLTWGPSPPDLDAHLTGPLPEGRFHVSFIDPGDCDESPFASLDTDDRSGFGPETISICEQMEGVYRYSVHDFTNSFSTTSSALGGSGAEVVVFRGSTEIGRFTPPNQPGTLWTVFELSGTTLTPVNQMSFQSDPRLITSRTLPGGISPALGPPLDLKRDGPET